MTDRLPPHDIASEVCVLGSMLLEPKAVSIARELVVAEDFYRPAHQIIFTAILYMADHPAKWGVPDLVTLRAALDERGKLEAVGGIDYLAELVEGVPMWQNVAHYARIVQDKSRLRQSIIATTQATQAAYEGGDPDTVLRDMADSLGKLGGKGQRTSSPADDVGANIEAAIAGKRQSIPWKWECITRWARACAPGAVTIICGDPGSGKSFLVQEAMLTWHMQGIVTAMFQLEKTRAFHQTRALGQLAANSHILSTEWQQAHPDEAREALERHRAVLDSYGHTVWDDPDGSMTIGSLTQWIAARLGEGARIVGADPVTAADPGGKPWEVDRQFIVSCESMAARHGASILLVTHPRNAGQGIPSLDSLAGGRAYGRLTDCIMWLQGHNPPADSPIKTPVGQEVMQHNRTLTLCKTRDGTGQGLKFALDFDRETLRTAQVGTIAKD